MQILRPIAGIHPAAVLQTVSSGMRGFSKRDNQILILNDQLTRNFRPVWRTGLMGASTVLGANLGNDP